MAFWGQHNISWQLIDHYMFDPKKGTLEQLIEEIEGCSQNKIIISSEAFFLLGPNEVASLRNYFSGFDVTIILYIRNQVDWLQSMWGEIAKGRAGVPEVEDADTWIQKKLKPRRDNDGSPAKNMGNYLLMIDLWSASFGEDNVLVRKFEDEIKGDVFKNFLSYVGIEDSAPFEQPEKVNESLDIQKLEFIRNMRIAMRKLEFPESAIEDVKWLVSQFESDVTDHLPGKTMYFSQHTYNEIVDSFGIVNKEIAARFFDGGTLFDENRIQRSFIGDQVTADSAAFDLFAKVLKHVSINAGKTDKLVGALNKARLKLGI